MDKYEEYHFKNGIISFIKSNEIPKIQKTKKEDIPIGIVSKILQKEWRVRTSIFHFKFDCRGKSINFAIKYNIPLKNEYFYSVCECLIL